MFPAPSNLETINSTFQKSCLPLLNEFTSSTTVLCDFPSKLQLTSPHVKIFGIDNLLQFLEASVSPHVQDVIILSQQSYILKKLLFSPQSMSKPFFYFTRVSSSYPLELKLIELVCSLPDRSFNKILNIEFCSSFSVQLRTLKSSFQKNFDICLLQFLASSSSPSIILPFPSFELFGILFSTDSELIFQTSQELAELSLSHTMHNKLQAKFSEKTECITLHIEVPDQPLFDQILASIHSICAVHLFIFSAVLSAIFSYPDDAFINFFPLHKTDPSPIISLFINCNIPYFLSHSFLVFKASPIGIEEAILQATELDLVIPPSFLTTSKKISFSLSTDGLSAQLLQAINSNLVELQITRVTPCTSNNVFFTNNFLSFLKARFDCLSTPKLCNVKSPEGYIHEVLSFTSSSQIFTTIGDDSLPLPFEHEGVKYCLSYLQPLQNQKPLPSSPYPFETHEEHFSRFQNTSDSLASRIPLFSPHKKYGSGSATNILMSISSGVCGDDSNPLSYFKSSSRSNFYFLISPFPPLWQNYLLTILPSPNYLFKEISLEDLLLHSPAFIIIDLLPRCQFDLPSFHPNGKKLLSTDWISILPFASSKLILFISSPSQLNTLYKYLIHDCDLPSPAITMGISDPVHETISSQPPSIHDEPPMEIEQLPPIFDPLSIPHAPILLTCYRLLSYLPWTDSSPHARQRLLECVAGGLHLNNHNIAPFLQAALDTFPVQDFFTSSNVLANFSLICSGLPDWASNALFCKQFFPQPPLVPPPPLPVLSLPTFPQTTTISDLHDAFLDIFTYFEDDFSIDLLNPAFLCSSPSFPLTLSSLFLQTISHRFSLSDEAKQRTSQPKRPIVLRLCSVLLELSPSTDVPPDSELSPHLLAEEFHPDSSSVSIYCPIKGLHIVPTSILFPYHISAVLFKRSSQSHLVSPLLLRKFASFSIPKPIPNSATPFAIISLFDGSGSFSDVISTAVGEWPHAIIAAEMDASTRAVVSKVKGWQVEGSLWSFDKQGAHTFYAHNVWTLIQDSCLLLRQFLSLLPPDTIIFVGAGSPCQDLTSIGRGKGVLGLVGDRSVHIHSVWALLYYLSHTAFWPRTVILVENAGSMQPHMKRYIHDLLGIPQECCHYLNCSKWGSVTRARYFFTSSNIAVLPSKSSSPFRPGWSPSLRLTSSSPPTLEPNPLPPWLRPRKTSDRGSVVQAPLAYHPKNLLYDISFFASSPEKADGWDRFSEACLANSPHLYPNIDFKSHLPEFLWKEWDALIDWKADFDAELTPEIVSTVSKLQDFYSSPYIYLPFRLPSLDEKAKDSELVELIETTKKDANPHIRTLHNIIGNFFKPSAVLAALGGTASIQNYVQGHVTPNQWSPLPPEQVELKFNELRTYVLSATTNLPTLHPHIVSRWFPSMVTKLESPDTWHTSLNMQTPPVSTCALSTSPPLPMDSPIDIPLPISLKAATLLYTHDCLSVLIPHSVFSTYPLSSLLSNSLPPFFHIPLPIFLTTSHLQQLCFLIAYFRGWELFQTRQSLLLLYEDGDSVVLYSFGSISDFHQLYLLSFSSTSSTFEFALLIQRISPPATLVPLLTKLRHLWQFPVPLQVYAPLLPRFPALTIFHNLSSPSPDTELYIPFSPSFVPLTLSPASLLSHIPSLFSSSPDQPMWTPSPPANFSGASPFIRHIQFWIAIHNQFQEEMQLPDPPFIFVSTITPGEIPSLPSGYFHMKDHPPPPSLLYSTPCPHIFIPDYVNDLTAEHYGITMGLATELYLDFHVEALSPYPVPYP